jgi:hypothetical protein
MQDRDEARKRNFFFVPFLLAHTFFISEKYQITKAEFSPPDFVSTFQGLIFGLSFGRVN